MKKVFILISMLIISGVAYSEAPTCHSAGYCGYTGKVSTVYVNAFGSILIYFDEPVTVSEASKAGFSITKTSAAIFHVADNPDVAKMFYSTALSAQATGRNIGMQMTGVSSGYLKFDRMSLASN
jgi:hypothetical protein